MLKVNLIEQFNFIQISDCYNENDNSHTLVVILKLLEKAVSWTAVQKNWTVIQQKDCPKKLDSDPTKVLSKKVDSDPTKGLSK